VNTYNNSNNNNNDKNYIYKNCLEVCVCKLNCNRSFGLVFVFGCPAPGQGRRRVDKRQL